MNGFAETASGESHAAIWTVTNSIDIVRARYDYQRDFLRVRATSTLGSGDSLSVEGFGPLNWNGTLWRKTFFGVPTPPVAVRVCGQEGCAAVK